MIYAMSDIHGCYQEFIASLELVDLSGDNKLILLGDYILGGGESYQVLDKIMELQSIYGKDKVIVLLGNHEEAVIEFGEAIDVGENKPNYVKWMKSLKRYHVEENTIFVHAGIEEEAGDLWKVATEDYVFTEKYPATLGRFKGSQKIVAGHIGTSHISGNPNFHDIFYDGESHYYIDGSVTISKHIPVLAVDTKHDIYYQVTSVGLNEIKSYKERSD